MLDNLAYRLCLGVYCMWYFVCFFSLSLCHLVMNKVAESNCVEAVAPLACCASGTTAPFAPPCLHAPLPISCIHNMISWQALTRGRTDHLRCNVHVRFSRQ